MASSRLIPLIIASALFMENMDWTVIATSLPAIARDLGTDAIVLKLAFTTYLLSLTVFIPVSGWLADRFGARHVFRVAIAVFTLGSIACGLATSLGGLVAARGLQGIGGAMMVPVGRIILLRTVPKSELVDALAWLTIPALIGPAAGAAGGRLHHRQLRLALDLLDEPALRHPRHRPGQLFMPDTQRGPRAAAGRQGLPAVRRGALGADLRPDGHGPRPAAGLEPHGAGGHRPGAVRALRAPCAGDGEPHPRPPPAAHRNLPGRRRRRQPVPHRRGGGALPAAADVPARLWHERLRSPASSPSSRRRAPSP